jgi:hypothetical protein
VVVCGDGYLDTLLFNSFVIHLSMKYMKLKGNISGASFLLSPLIIVLAHFPFSTIMVL